MAPKPSASTKSVAPVVASPKRAPRPSSEPAAESSEAGCILVASDEEFESASRSVWLPPRPPPGDPRLCGILRLRSVPYEATKTFVELAADFIDEVEARARPG